LPESTALKPTKLRAVFVPQVMGIFVLLIIILAFVAGAVRQELALMLAGAVFLALWIYCLVMTLLLALTHNRRARRAFIRITPREIAVNSLAEAIYSEGKDIAFNGRIAQLPGILVRCRLLLATKDGRRIRYEFNPRFERADSAPHFFDVEKRGAYFSAYDEFAVFDILGFFRFVFRLPVENGARLLACPRAADEPPVVSARAGESSLKPEFSIQRTDNLIDHRPYVPGDDPRRINWKLYSHGGGLLVREGEYEPPPQSNIVILIDAEYDPLLYSGPQARQGIDLLCENALAAALACTESGMDVLIGYSGGVIPGVIQGGNVSPLPASELAAALAWPAASPLSAAAKLPAAPDNCGVLILALPRSSAATSAMDHFLNDTSNRPVELLFLYGSDGNTVAYSERLAAAEVCAALYNQRAGVRARVFGV
jgi:uncharacterized protein (DUF58 family)